MIIVKKNSSNEQSRLKIDLLRFIVKITVVQPNENSIKWNSFKIDLQKLINFIKTDLDSELMLFNEEANEVIYVLA